MSKRQDYRHKKQRNRQQGRRSAHKQDARRTGEYSLIYGFHAAEAALANPERAILSVLATQAAADRVQPLLAKRNIAPSIVAADVLTNRLGEQAVHQGILIETAPLAPPAIEDLAPASPLLVLDQVTDPQNVGAILRSAAAFSAGAVIVQDRNAPQPSGALAKAATGALEHVPYVQVTNIVRALEQLKRDGYWIIGLDGSGEAALEAALQDRTPVVLVLGAEGSGLRRLTMEACDLVARLDLPGPIKTLNVSNAAAIALSMTTRAGQ